MNFVKPIEQNFRFSFKEDEVNFWFDELARSGMTRRGIVQTVDFIQRDCKFPPSLYDFHRLRPKPAEPDYSDPPSEIKDIPTTPGSWGEFVVRTVAKYSKRDRVKMYELQVVEAERRGGDLDQVGLQRALVLAKEAKARRVENAG